MATLILTTVGTALGGPIGGTLGSLVGQSIDHGLFGPGMRKGPRLGDLSVQTSSYGSPIPRIYGTMRVAGTVIWATDLKEEEEIEGGGKGSPERLTYSYSANLAVALSSRPVEAVRRIWADGKLIRGTAGDFKVKTKFRLLTGSEDQGVDPLIAAAETINQAPAYRGLALAVFEDLELAEFGNRIPVLTFEVVAGEDPVALPALLEDASRALILAEDAKTIGGFAVHGTSIGDALRPLIDVSGIALTERDGALRTPPIAAPAQLADEELGCAADGNRRPLIEHVRAASSSLPAGLTMTYYDPDRDYQSGQMRASAGQGGARGEQIELPAVLTGSQAKQLVEEALARRWRGAERIRLRLPPHRATLRPGDPIQLPGSGRAWTCRSVEIEGMAVAVEAEASPVSVQPLPADPGRPISEPDIAVGRTEIQLIELPEFGEAPAGSIKVQVAGSNPGLWKPVPVEITVAGTQQQGIALSRSAVAGHAVTLIDACSPMLLDELSSVEVRLADSAHTLFNADWDALVAGVNLAVLGEELIQFGRAEQLAPGLYRLSKLLRGRRGTEWATATHAVGEGFCLVDAATHRTIDLPASALGGVLSCIAHGVGDNAPLPEASRILSGEAMRPPSPCHLRLARQGSDLRADWVRRSYRNWAWIDGVGDGVDGFAEAYRMSLQGPSGTLTVETVQPFATLGPAQLPGGAGQSINVAVATIGHAALSHPATASIIL